MNKEYAVNNERENSEYSVDRNRKARFFYSHTNEPVEDKGKNELSFDDQGSMEIWDEKEDTIEIRTFYDDGLTIKSRFVASRIGDKLNYKVGYDETGTTIYKTIYKRGLPYRVIKYERDKNVIYKCRSQRL